MKRSIALLLALALILGLSATALAEGNGRSHSKAPAGGKPAPGTVVAPADGQAGTETEGADTGLSDSDRSIRERVKERLHQDQENHGKTRLTPEERQQQVAALKTEIAKLQSLQRQAVDLRRQVNTALKTLRQTIDGAQKGQKWQALRDALPGLKAVQQRTGDIREEYQQSEGAMEAFEDAHSSSDVQAAVAAIQDAEVRVQARIDALQQVLDAVNQVTQQIQTAPADPTAPAAGTGLAPSTTETKPDEDSNTTSTTVTP